MDRHLILNRCSLICLWLNTVLMVMKLGTGYFYESRALFADGMHSLLDVTADIFVLYTVSMARLPTDEKHPYGYSRYETLGNIVISLMLVGASVMIIYDAILGLDQPMMPLQPIVAIAAVLSIIANEISYQYVASRAKSIKSDLLLSTAVHQRADAATSLVVLIAAIASLYGFAIADTLGAIIIAVMIGYYALPSLLKSLEELMDKGLDPSDIEVIKNTILQVDGVRDHHFLRSRRMAEKGYIDVHIVVSSRISVSEGHYIGDMVKASLLLLDGISDVTVHIDAEDDQEIEHQQPDRKAVEKWLASESIVFDRLVIHYLVGGVELEIFLKQGVMLPDIRYPSWLRDITVYYVT